MRATIRKRLDKLEEAHRPKEATCEMSDIEKESRLIFLMTTKPEYRQDPWAVGFLAEVRRRLGKPVEGPP